MTGGVVWTAARGGEPQGRTAYTNARLLDPATGLDVKGALLTDGESSPPTSTALYGLP